MHTLIIYHNDYISYVYSTLKCQNFIYMDQKLAIDRPIYVQAPSDLTLLGHQQAAC